MSRTYARCPSGQRAFSKKLFHKGNHITIVGALGLHKMKASMTIEGSLDGDSFLIFIKEILSPQLKKGDIVVMDNLSVHKVNGVEEAIKKCGAYLVYLPPYSPEFNPIEECWSKIKAIIRKFKAATIINFHDALDNALARVSKNDIWGWFKHAGVFNFQN